MNKETDDMLCDKWLLEFPTYEDYLDSLITPRDLFHLRSKSIARRIIELGYHTEGTLDRNTFYKRVKVSDRLVYIKDHPFDLCSKHIEIPDALMQALATREQANRRGEIFTIIFMKHMGKSQSPITAFIDYANKLKTEDWKPFFEGSAKLTPKKTDLLYFDWKARKSIYNSSPYFRPLIDGKRGLVFEHIRDSNIMVIDTSSTIKSNPRRERILSEMYGQVVLYDYLGDICDCNVQD